MTSVKISDLNPLAAPDVADLLAIVDLTAGETMRLTLGVLRDFVFAAGITDSIHGNLSGGALHAAFTAVDNGFVPAPGVVTGKFLRDDGSWQGGVVTSVAAIGSTPNASGSRIIGNALNLEPASASFGGVVTTGTQTFAGAKTFNDGITLGAPLSIASGGTGETSASAAINALVPVQTGNNGQFLTTDGSVVSWATVPVAVTTMAAIGASPNANGATISGAFLNLEPASAAFGGVVTTSAQVFAGAKTFNDGIVLGTPLPITSGGTGEISAAAAINALVPSQAGNNGKYLTTDGSVVSWSAVVSLAIGNNVTGSTVGSVLFVGASNLLAEDNANLFWDDTGNTFSVGTATGNERVTINGRLSLAETTAPTSTAGFGKLWTQTASDDVGSRLYFMGDLTSTAQLVQLAGQSDVLGDGGAITLDFSPSLSWNRIMATLTSNPIFTTSNLGVGRSMTVFVTGGAAPYTPTFPVGWNWLTSAPTSIAAGDVGVLTLFSTTAADTGIIAAWSYENAPPTPIGSGTTNRVAYWSSGIEIAADDDLFFDGVNFAVGTTAPTARAHLVGSQARSIATVSTNTTLDDTHHTVKVDATGGARTITLPPASSNTDVIYIIKKIDASANTVTVDGNLSETIDGAATYVLSVQYAAVKLHCDGTSWWVIP